jgi:tetratricopeptide (TPR) repeat protein
MDVVHAAVNAGSCVGFRSAKADQPRARVGALALASAIILVASAAWGEGESRDVAGRAILQRDAVLMDGYRVVASPGPYCVYRVEEASGEWVRIRSDRTAGWVKSADVVPIEKAVEFLTAQIDARPDSSWAYALRGAVYEALGEPKIALSDYNMALQLDPKDPYALVMRGDLRAAARRDYRRAIADYDEAIRLNPRLPGAFVRRGDARRGQGENDRAVADYDQAIALDAQYPAAFRGRGLARLAAGDPDRAIDDLDKSARLDPNSAEGFVALGDAWFEKHDDDRAIDNYDEALRIAPESASVLARRGMAWLGKKAHEHALSDLSAAIRLDPNDAQAYFHRGRAWKAAGKYSAALADYNEALRLAPAHAEVHNGRAWLQATCPDGSLRNGRAAYDSAVRACSLTNWSDPRDLDTLAACYAESRDFARAVEWEQKSIALSRNEAEKAEYHARLRLYLANQPFREAPANP